METGMENASHQEVKSLSGGSGEQRGADERAEREETQRKEKESREAGADWIDAQHIARQFEALLVSELSVDDRCSVERSAIAAARERLAAMRNPTAADVVRKAIENYESRSRTH
jgi:hypothetical protein